MLGIYLDTSFTFSRIQSDDLPGRSDVVNRYPTRRYRRQDALSQLRVLVTGSANGIADVLVLLDDSSLFNQW